MERITKKIKAGGLRQAATPPQQPGRCEGEDTRHSVMASMPYNPAWQDTVDNFMKTRPNLEAGLQFLLVEIDTGLTFARIAQAARAKSPRKFERNLQNARKAYDSALRFRRASVLEPEQKTTVDTKLEQLKTALRGLGEEV